MSRVLKTGNTQVTCTYAEHYEKFKNRLSTACGVDVVKHYNQCDWITAHTDGTVIKVVNYLDGTNGVLDKEGCAYGNYVMIEHRDKLVTLYAHLEKVQVKEGQKVAKGTVLGFMGNTGGSFGAHLHFEIRGYNKPLSTVYVHDLTAYKYLNAQAYIDINLPVPTPTPKPAEEDLSKNTIPNRFKVLNKDGKQLGAYTSYPLACNFANTIAGAIVIDSANNGKQLYPKEVIKKKLTPTSYPDYTGSDVYRVRKSFNDKLSSKGSFQIWKYVFNTWNDNKAYGYHIYDKNGKQLD